jgi:hypothetical protein
MKSGNNSIDRDNKQFREALLAITDRQFEQRTFSSRPALITKKPASDPRVLHEIQDYRGQHYDPSNFEFVEGLWDHDHCSECGFEITAGHTYWENPKNSIV